MGLFSGGLNTSRDGRFSADAENFGRPITPRVVMIDGVRLGQLMLTHGVGVQERQVFRVVEVDEDFFEDV